MNESRIKFRNTLIIVLLVIVMGIQVYLIYENNKLKTELRAQLQEERIRVDNKLYDLGKDYDNLSNRISNNDNDIMEIAKNLSDHLGRAVVIPDWIYGLK